MDPTDAGASMNLGDFLLKQGRIIEARDCYLNVVQLLPESCEGWMMLGCAYALNGENEKARSCHARAVSLSGESADVWLRVAGIYHLHGRPHGAAQACRHALEHRPQDPDIWSLLGHVCRETGDTGAAIDAYQQTLALQPGDQTILASLAELQLQAGLFDPAINTCHAILRMQPDAAFVHGILGTALQSQGNLVEARQSLERCVKLQPGNAVCCYKFACCLQTLGKLDEALHYFSRARSLAPDMSAAVGGLARVYAQKNDEAALRELLDPLIEAAGKNPLVLPTLASIAPRFGLTAKAIEMLHHAIAARRLPNNVLTRLHWALGTLYESMHEYDNAFTNHARSKSLAASRYNAATHADFTNRIINVFSREFLATVPRTSGTSQLPLFIVGMPRSGTSLVEQIVSSHPKVHGAGELPDISRIANSLSKMTPSGKPYPECVRELKPEHLNECATHYLDMLRQLDHDALRITDKMPHNFRHLGLIQLLFPEARVIHVARDPLDTCLSCYFQEFSAAHAYTRSLRDLGSHYLDYKRLMQHWRFTLSIPMLTLRYEDIVGNFEKFTRQLIEFCGLEWNDACLDFHHHERVVSTLSSDQVRKPIYNSSVGRWKNYRSHLDGLLNIFDVRRG